MLSASDAGRIGRLVLPKKCAEVSFHVSQLEGKFGFRHKILMSSYLMSRYVYLPNLTQESSYFE